MDRFQNTKQPDWDWWGRLWAAPGETLRDLGLESGDDVAEVCSGNGYFAIPAARIIETGDVYAIDIDGGLLEELKEVAEMNGVTNVETVAVDACEFSDHVGTGDVALLANTLHGVDDTKNILTECHEAIADDGILVVVNWHDRPREETTVAGEPRGPPNELRMSPDETTEAVTEAADFVERERMELPPYHYAVIFCSDISTR